VIRKVKPVKTIESIRGHELELYSVLTEAVRIIEEAFSDGRVERYELRQIDHKTNELRRKAAELVETIRRGARL
jgi:hypothetical protein